MQNKIKRPVELVDFYLFLAPYSFPDIKEYIGK